MASTLFLHSCLGVFRTAWTCSIGDPFFQSKLSGCFDALIGAWLCWPHPTERELIPTLQRIKLAQWDKNSVTRPVTRPVTRVHPWNLKWACDVCYWEMMKLNPWYVWQPEILAASSWSGLWNVFVVEWFYLICCYFGFEGNLGSSFPVSCLECPNSLCFNKFRLQQSFYCGFQWTISIDDCTFGYVLSSFWIQGWDGCWDKWRFCFALPSLDTLFEFGRLIWVVKDLMVLLFFCSCLWRLFSEKRQCSRECWMISSLFAVAISEQAAYLSFRFLKIQIQRNSIQYFQRSFD